MEWGNLPNYRSCVALMPFASVENITLRSSAAFTFAETDDDHEGDAIRPLRRFHRLKRLSIQTNGDFSTFPWTDLPVQLETLEVELNPIHAIFHIDTSELSNLKRIDVVANSQAKILIRNWNSLKSLDSLLLTRCYFDLDQRILPDSLCDDWPMISQVLISSVSLPHHFANSPLPNSISRCHRLTRFVMPNYAFSSGNIAGFGALTTLKQLSVPSSNLEGSLPSSFFNQVNISRLDLSNNRISGTLPGGIAPIELNLLNNDISGPLSALDWSACQKLDISKNRFSGTIPANWALPKRWQALELAYNELEGEIPNLHISQLVIDLSHNRFAAFLINRVVATASLDISHNQISRFLPNFGSGWLRYLYNFDASYNMIRNVTSWLEGEPVTVGPGRVWHLEGNHIATSFSEVRELHDMYWAVELHMSGNYISGSLDEMLAPRNDTPQGFARQYDLLDFSNCHLNGAFSQHILADYLADVNLPKLLSIEDNPDLPHFNMLEGFKLAPIGLQGPPGAPPKTQCPLVVPIGSNLNTQFTYDVGLWNYVQCSCIPPFYGKAPNCFDCPTLAHATFSPYTSALCDTGNSVDISPDHYAYQATDPTFIAHHGPLAVESCLSDPIFRGFSNCIGSTIYINQSTDLQDLELNLIPQCSTGSQGRLCSHCSCPDPSDPSSCYYLRGISCIKCNRGPLSTAAIITISIAVILVILAILSPIMFLVLKSSRKVEDKPWKELSLGKRLLYRSLHAARMGYLSILIGFLQIMAGAVEFNHVVLRFWLGLANGQFSGTGVICLLPFLREPLASLLLRLLLPFGVCLLIILSIVLGELIWRVTKKREAHFEDVISDSNDDMKPLVSSNSSNGKIENRYYPWQALATSVSITIIQFFYFNISLASMEYFVPDTSEKDRTSDFYVESTPWMKMSEAHALRMTSIPFLIFVVAGLPLGLLVMLLKYGRIRSMSSTMRLYLGSLMDKYCQGCAWWELFRLSLKLLVAVFLKTISFYSAWRFALVIFLLSLGVSMMLIALWKKISIWNRKFENVADAISYQLLGFTFIAISNRSYNHASSVFIASLSLNGAFVILLFAIWIHVSWTEPVSSTSSIPHEQISDGWETEEDYPGGHSMNTSNVAGQEEEEEEPALNTRDSFVIFTSSDDD